MARRPAPSLDQMIDATISRARLRDPACLAAAGGWSPVEPAPSARQLRPAGVADASSIGDPCRYERPAPQQTISWHQSSSLSRRGAGRADPGARPARGDRAETRRDSRPGLRRERATEGSLFFCVPGSRVDGHDFAADGGGERARPRSSSSGRSTSTCRSSSSRTHALRWRSQPISSSASRRARSTSPA